ncbi:MAG: hypothetical protein M1120_03830 [Patescibacteria group bacterium]|nr:hypothetical protein [Patescibacteria group bacterium]
MSIKKILFKKYRLPFWLILVVLFMAVLLFFLFWQNFQSNSSISYSRYLCDSGLCQKTIPNLPNHVCRRGGSCTE